MEQTEHSAEPEKALEQMETEFEELENSKFMQIFRPAFEKVLRKGAQEHVEVNTGRVKILYAVFERLSSLLGGEAKIEMLPAFLMGAVVIKTDLVDLNGQETKELSEILSQCGTVSIVPSTDGTISFSITVSGVFRK